MSATLADGVLAIVKAATDPLFARIKALEADIVALKAAPPTPGPAGQDGRPGRDGQDADPEAVKALQATVAGLSREVGGLRETREQSGTAVADLVKAAVDHAVASLLPLPELPDVAGLVADEMAKAIANIPAPKDGRDGVGVAGAIIDREGGLVLTLSDGTTKALGLVVGQKGEPGRDGVDGRDGVGFHDLEEAYEDDGRVLVRRFLRDGAVVREFRHSTKQLVYRGVYEPDKTYAAGDAVTWGGAVWVAKCETSAKPDDHGPVRDWQLAVKRGSEGKRGEKGDPGERGVQGLRGEKGEPGRWS